LDILKTEQAAEYLQLSEASLNRWRCYGGGPEYVMLGRAIRYRRSDLEAWLQSRVRSNTSQGGAK
jgi:excisionase family DNA binding protein